MSTPLLKLIPQPLRKKAFEQVSNYYEGQFKKMSADIPKYNLENKHIENAKMIANREELLKLLPKNAVVAELGVDEGSFTELIFKNCNPKKMHLVDFWGSERYNQNKRQNVESKFRQQINDKTLEINLGLSTQVVNDFKDDYFDWIYIDTDHSYKTTYEELVTYSTKVKADGFMAGHDFILGNWDGMVRYGVIEAVHEFCLKYNWEIIYVTVELSNNPSFAIRRIS